VNVAFRTGTVVQIGMLSGIARPRRAAGALAVAIAAGAFAAVWLLPPSGPRSARHSVTQSRHRAVRPRDIDPRASTAAVPILMYHVIARAPAGAPFPGLYVPRPEFVAQMRALAKAGYHAVTLDRVWNAWHGEARLPPRPVVLSFDNGYRTQYTVARPVLRRLGWVGDENLQLTGLPPGQGGLGRPEVRALVAAGWELDTQGYSHADLIRLDARQLRYQIGAARTEMRRLFHVGASWFCYPSGHYDSSVIAAVKAAGYLGSTTVVPGWARPRDDPYRLPRLRVVAGTSPAALLALIAATRESPFPPPAYPS
jgi:peptidoglycan/xylan/chitin deacetylase (PgdA/CDA1 family)